MITIYLHSYEGKEMKGGENKTYPSETKQEGERAAATPSQPRRTLPRPLGHATIVIPDVLLCAHGKFGKLL